MGGKGATPPENKARASLRENRARMNEPHKEYIWRRNSALQEESARTQSGIRRTTFWRSPGAARRRRRTESPGLGAGAGAARSPIPTRPGLGAARAGPGEVVVGGGGGAGAGCARLPGGAGRGGAGWPRAAARRLAARERPRATPLPGGVWRELPLGRPKPPRRRHALGARRVCRARGTARACPPQGPGPLGRRALPGAGRRRARLWLRPGGVWTGVAMAAARPARSPTPACRWGAGEL